MKKRFLSPDFYFLFCLSKLRKNHDAWTFLYDRDSQAIYSFRQSPQASLESNRLVETVAWEFQAHI